MRLNELIHRVAENVPQAEIKRAELGFGIFFGLLLLLRCWWLNHRCGRERSSGEVVQG